ncbi:MAG: hypothetical protein QGH39_11535 [Candidatus Thermoplasmatota archaeon]|nr:hypothetical protein [Candidatus Thermoplasmatota archaeon]
MRRRAYPYGRYLIEGKKIDEVGPKLRDFVKELGFPITKFDVKNEGKGTLIVAVNKKIMELDNAYKKIFSSKNLHENLTKINGEYKENDLVSEVIKFISKDKKRPICTPHSK